MNIYLRLYYEFFKTGLFAIGGGMATLPFLHDIGETTGWYTQAQLMNMLAVSESTPGPIGINMATYVGYTVGGIPGAIIATIGEVTPSIIVILIVAMMLKKFRDSKYVNDAFYGLRPASTGLIGAAAAPGCSAPRRAGSTPNGTCPAWRRCSAAAASTPTCSAARRWKSVITRPTRRAAATTPHPV